MAASAPAPRLTDILDAIVRIRAEMEGVTIDAFEADWRKRWLVERGVEIIAHVTGDLSNAVEHGREFHALRIGRWPAGPAWLVIWRRFS